MFCPNCGKEIEEGKTLCPYCWVEIPQNISGNKQFEPTQSVSEQPVEEVNKETAAPVPHDSANGIPEAIPESAAEEEPNAQETGSEIVNPSTPQGTDNSTAMPKDNPKIGGTRNTGNMSPIPPENDTASFNNAYQQPSPSSVGSKPGLDSKRIICIIAAAVVAVFVIFSLTHRKTKINVNKFLNVTFDGYNTVGTATAEIDREKFLEKYKDIKINKSKIKKYAKKELGLSNEEMEEFGGLLSELEDSDPVVSLYTSIRSCSHLDKTKGLSNGDTVTWDCSFSESDYDFFEKIYNCKVVYKEKKFKVEGLEDAEVYDPFKSVEVSFSGAEPSGEAKIVNNAMDDIGSEISYSISPSYGLSNGDKVKVSISNGDQDYYIEKFGVIISPTEKEFTVENLSFYISSAKDIPDDVLSKMQKEVQDQFDAEVAKDWSKEQDNKVVVNNFEYIGNYVLNSKSDDSYSGNNYLYLIYRVDVEGFKQGAKGIYDEPLTYYTYWYYKDLAVASNGMVNIDYNDIQKCDNRFDVDTNLGGWSTGWYYEGFRDLDSLYNDVVTSNADKYSSEDNVKDIPFDNKPTLLTKIPEEALEHNGHYYLTYNASGITWTEADSQCKKLGGHLVTITDEEEQNYVRNFLTSSYSNYWIGFKRSEDTSEWAWVTGESFDYTNWDSWEDFKNTYGRMQSDGDWNSQDNDDSSSGFICEWDSDKISEAGTSVVESDKEQTEQTEQAESESKSESETEKPSEEQEQSTQSADKKQ